jgi:hypothetical protein
MRATTTWDDPDLDDTRVGGWSVMHTLRSRQLLYCNEVMAAQQRIAAREGNAYFMTAAQIKQVYEDSIKARWQGGPTVLAFLFALPDSDAIQMLDARGEYFDVRTGDTWDLFFPGYYRSTRGPEFERRTGGRPVGVSYADDWYFNPKDFNDLRKHIEQSSDQRWEYSGGTDLVLINGWLAVEGEPTIDWVSTISGQVSDRITGTQTLTLANVIERITRDLENAAEDSSYGVGEVTDGSLQQENHVGRDFMINVLSGIAAALGAKALGA